MEDWLNKNDNTCARAHMDTHIHTGSELKGKNDLIESIKQGCILNSKDERSNQNKQNQNLKKKLWSKMFTSQIFLFKGLDSYNNKGIQIVVIYRDSV